MADWKTLSSEVIHETPWIKLRKDEVLTHKGKQLTYTFMELHHPSVFVVAVNDEGKILLQKNYRYTIKQTIWELPAGHSDGQEPLVAARRELLEEDGMESEDWTNLGRTYQAIGTTNAPMDVCLARNVRTVKEAAAEDDELIVERRFFAPSEIDDMIKHGEIINIADMGAIHMALIHGLTKEAK
jgi:8-oxo-dGTP pyrophosphatase MutT (NUDIX family)